MSQCSGISSIIVGVGVVVKRLDCVALGRRRDTPECWSLPGGKIEVLESIGECARRELYEETDLRALDGPEVMCVANIRAPGLHSVTFGILFHDVAGDLRLCEPDRFSAWMWCPLTNLPDDCYAPTRVILDILRNETASGHYLGASTRCRLVDAHFPEATGGNA
jgi:8-oxo-dGTP diphosphatase